MAQRQTIPVLPLRGTVIFPGLTAPIAAGRPGTLRAIESALKGDRLVFAVAQRDIPEARTESVFDVRHCAHRTDPARLAAAAAASRYSARPRFSTHDRRISQRRIFLQRDESGRRKRSFIHRLQGTRERAMSSSSVAAAR